MSYASRTEVTADKSRTEIERLLTRYGATSFVYGWDREAAIVQFEMEDRRVRFRVPLPDPDEFAETPTGRKRKAEAQRHEYEQATRQRWRALKLIVQAKLEAVASGVATFDEEFLSYLVLPAGGTVGDWALPQVAAAYTSGDLPKALPGSTGNEERKST